MRKLTLDPEALRVETFRTATAPAGRGTIHAARAVIGGELLPAARDSECTEPCMSNQSECPIMSCGSDCNTDQPQTGIGY